LSSVRRNTRKTDLGTSTAARREELEVDSLRTSEELADIDAIARLTARYVRLLDTQQLDDLLDLFTDDVVNNVNEGELVSTAARSCAS